MHKRHISVGDLQFGMYIVELDRPWNDTPFMFQGFYLRTPSAARSSAQALQARVRRCCAKWSAGGGSAGRTIAPDKHPGIQD
jgi:hypothetical protein